MEESFGVKVADFGFARIKEDNATMTRCGTPSWTGTNPNYFFISSLLSALFLPQRSCHFQHMHADTYTHHLVLFLCAAPEIIRGEKYSEVADVYSFGIVMWQVKIINIVTL